MKDSNREAFEELIDIEIIISEGFKFNPNINQYYHPDHTNHRLSYAYLMGAWMVWQEKAQAIPEGFVLVPVDTLEECLNWAHIAKWDSPSNEVDKKIAHHEAIIESAISAQEPTND